jgi:hypothetical protein
MNERLECVGTEPKNDKLSELDKAVNRISSSMEITPSKITVTYPPPKDEWGRSRTFSLDEIQQCLDNALMNGATGSESSGFCGPFSVDIPTAYALQTIPPPSFKDPKKPARKRLKENITNHITWENFGIAFLVLMMFLVVLSTLLLLFMS